GFHVTGVQTCALPICSIDVFAAVSAAICAAYGVDLREPLKPRAPAEDQEIAFPCASVIVTIVLLKVERMCAIPFSIFFFTRRLRVFVLRAMIISYLLYLLFFLTCNCFTWSLTSTSIVLRILTANR